MSGNVISFWYPYWPSLLRVVWKVKAEGEVLGGGGSRWWRPRRCRPMPMPVCRRCCQCLPPRPAPKVSEAGLTVVGRSRRSQSSLPLTNVASGCVLFSNIGSGGLCKVALVVAPVWIMIARWVLFLRHCCQSLVGGGKLAIIYGRAHGYFETLGHADYWSLFQGGNAGKGGTGRNFWAVGPDFIHIDLFNLPTFRWNHLQCIGNWSLRTCIGEPIILFSRSKLGFCQSVFWTIQLTGLFNCNKAVFATKNPWSLHKIGQIIKSLNVPGRNIWYRQRKRITSHKSGIFKLLQTSCLEGPHF